MNIKNKLRLLPGVVFILLAALLWRGLFLHPHLLPSAKVGELLPGFKLTTLQTDKSLPTSVAPTDDKYSLTSTDFKGKYTLLNVWASWCDSCAQEQGFLMQLAKQGVVIYGLNYKDNAHQAKVWLNTWGNPYRRVGVDTLGKVAIELGVYGTPETFLISPAGRILYRHPGVLTKAIWLKFFVPKIIDSPQSPRFQNLLKELRCLVCQNQDLLDSQAPLAVDLKKRVYELMQSGQSDAAIKQYLAARYGDFILFKPPIKPSTWVLWIAPFLLLLLGLLGLIFWVKRGALDG